MLIYINDKLISFEKAKKIFPDKQYYWRCGIFETLRSYNGKIFKLEEHIERFFESAKSCGLQINKNKIEIKKILYKTLKANKLKDAYIRLSFNSGYFVVIAKEFKRYEDNLYKLGVKVITSTYRRENYFTYRMKSANFLESILGKTNANKEYFEIIFLNKEGYITEGTVSNIFIVKNNILITPPTFLGILEGITRNTVIEIAKKIKIKFMENIITLHNLYNADECFLTNTSLEIMPVVNIDGRIIKNSRVGEITNKLIKNFNTYVSY